MTFEHAERMLKIDKLASPAAIENAYKECCDSFNKKPHADKEAAARYVQKLIKAKETLLFQNQEKVRYKCGCDEYVGFAYDAACKGMAKFCAAKKGKKYVVGGAGLLILAKVISTILANNHTNDAMTVLCYYGAVIAFVGYIMYHIREKAAMEQFIYFREQFFDRRERFGWLK